MLYVYFISNSLMNSRQCTRSVYAYDWSSIFLNHCSLLMFLYFCGFLTSIEISRFHLPSLWINIYQRSFTVTILLSSGSLLYITALIGSLFFSRILTWNPSVICLQILLWWISFEHRLFISIFISLLLFSYVSADIVF